MSKQSEIRREAEGRIARVIAALAPAVVDAVDIQRVLEGVDVSQLLAQVDVNELVSQVDVDALLSRVDVQQLLMRIDVNALLDQIDVDALVQRIDLDGLLARVDVEALMVRANVGELVAESTSELAGSTLDLGRRQLVGLDTVIARLINGALRRRSEELPAGPPGLVDGDAGDGGP